MNLFTLAGILTVLALFLEWVFRLNGGLLIPVLIFLLFLLFWQQHRLLLWVRAGCKPPVPFLFSPFAEIAQRLLRQREQARKRKRRLQRMLLFFREVAGAVPDASVVVNRDGVLVSFNRRAQQLLGLDKNQDSGRPIDHFVRSASMDSFWQKIREHDQLQLRLISDENCWLEFSRVPLTQGNSLLIARDVSSTMILDVKRKAFIDNASHELKTPITVIRGFLEVMTPETLPEKWRQPVREMRKHTERMQLLVEDMLQLAQLESPDQVLVEQSLSLSNFLDDLIVEINQDFAGSVGAVCGFVEPLVINADPMILHSMLYNLLANALMHADSRSAVEVTCARSERHLLIGVSDDGIGIAPEHLTRITERFYRVDRNRARVKGSGLGLAIVKHGAEVHGGSLSVQSSPGRGTSFTISLPVSRVIAQNLPPES